MSEALNHRQLGNQLDLFYFESEIAPGSPFFLPKGTILYNELKNFVRRIYGKEGYQEIITPQIMDSSLWKTSGHYDHFKENMYWCQVDEQECGVKPMNCPGHMLMFRSRNRSYRELPLRLADFGRLHRYELSGSITGLTRVRTFCQDDAHIFIRSSQLEEEMKRVLNIFDAVYNHFGFEDIKVSLSTRPEGKKAGSDEMWDYAEGELEKALKDRGKPYGIKEGDGAFYGPKIDIEVKDSLGRYWQLGTAQLDFNLPERFGLSFSNEKNEEEQPLVIHRAIFGSIERFIAILLEHTQGALPFWLAPEQIVFIPVDINSESQRGYIDKCVKNWPALRSRIDDRNESLGLKTRESQVAKIPLMVVVGDREVKENKLTVRFYGHKKPETFDVNIFLARLHQLQDEGTL